MKKFKKLAIPLVGGMLLAVALYLSVGLVYATPEVVPPQPTECTECDEIQGLIDTEIVALSLVSADLIPVMIGTEQMLVNVELELGSLGDVPGQLTSLSELGMLGQGSECTNPDDMFPYYTIFDYDGTDYCFHDVAEFDNFFQLMWGNIFQSTTMDGGWIDLHFSLWDILSDPSGFEDDDSDDLEDIIDALTGLFLLLESCELDFCPVIVCPDCETIAADLDQALDDLDLLELEADLLDAELTDLEADIDSVFDDMNELEALREAYRQMVLDAGGMVDADCDGFEVGSGQGWGIAHNFGDVQWCATSETQIEELIRNLEEYWQNNKNQHLPTEAQLNAELDQLMGDYLLLLDEYFAVLDDIDAQNDLIDALMLELADCLDELEALQDLGFCLDQDAAAMRDLLAEAAGLPPFTPTPPADEPPADEPTGDELEDILGHWAEQFIRNLFGAGVVSGDSDTGLFRPNDNLNRAEASKMILLANGDFVVDSFFDVFFDVTIDDWFWIYANSASDLGYFFGYDDGSFGPGNSILRAEAVAVVLRALGFDIPEYTEYSFPDLTGDEWYADYAEKAFQCGIITGRDGMLAGGDTITRAEFSKIVDVALLAGLLATDCADFVCPDCDDEWAEVELLGLELDFLDIELDALWDQMTELETLRDAFRQMVQNAGGMTDADCDGFEVGSGQALGVAHSFGDVQYCLTAESQIPSLTNQLSEYWQNNSSSHLPSEQQFQDDIDQNMNNYIDTFEEWLAALEDYEDCLDELAALQDQGLCLDSQ